MDQSSLLPSVEGMHNESLFRWNEKATYSDFPQTILSLSALNTVSQIPRKSEKFKLGEA